MKLRRTEVRATRLSRYVVLNPVRAGIVQSPEQWPWSSYRATIGKVAAPGWLAVDGLLRLFGDSRHGARRNYRRFVLEGMAANATEDLWGGLRQQIYLGDERFVTRMQRRARIRSDALSVPQAQRRPPAPSLSDIATRYPERNAAMVAVYATGANSYREIATHFGVHLATVGRIVRAAMQQ